MFRKAKYFCGEKKTLEIKGKTTTTATKKHGSSLIKFSSFIIIGVKIAEIQNILKTSE